MVRELLETGKSLNRLSPQIRDFFVSVTVMSFIFEILKLIPPVLFKEIIDKLVVYQPGTGLSFELVAVLILAYSVSMLVMSVFDIIFQRVIDNKIRDPEVDIAERAVMKMLHLDTSYHENNETGASINKILKGQTKIFDLLFNMMYVLFPTLFQALFTAVLLFYFSWQIGVLFLVVVPIFLTLIFWGASRTHKAREAYHAHYDRFAGTFAQSISNVRTVKDFNTEQREFEKASTQLHKYRVAVSERVKLGLSHTLYQSLLIVAARVCTLIIAVWLLVNGNISAGSLVLIMTLSEKAYINLDRLYRIYYTMQDAEPSIRRLNDLSQAEVRVHEGSSPHTITKGSIHFENVSFKYSAGQEALKNINFSIEPKQTIALVGRSGSGKSTAVKLLLRHADPTSGKILIDGKPSNEYTFANLRGAMAVVSQDVELFNDTVHGNIAYGVDHASREQVIAAAKLANAHDFIMKLPHGYETIVGERGIKLSGGQKQRVAIARALLRKPKILVFDEATSSLDAESEQKIHEAIFGLSGKLTLIMIAHRFSTIEHADKIILLENGEVKEIGTHAQLIKKKGIFAKLRKLQQLGEVD